MCAMPAANPWNPQDFRTPALLVTTGFRWDNPAAPERYRCTWDGDPTTRVILTGAQIQQAGVYDLWVRVGAPPDWERQLNGVSQVGIEPITVGGQNFYYLA